MKELVEEKAVPPIKKSRPLSWFLFAFLGSLFFFLLGGGIPVATSFPEVLIRFTGVETTARANATGYCDEGDYYTFTFTDKYEKVYHITNSSTCFSGVFSDGEHVQLWYQPDHPEQFVTANEMSFDLTFVVAFSIPLDITIIALLVFCYRRLSGFLWRREMGERFSGQSNLF